MFKIIRNFIYLCLFIGVFGLVIAWIYAKKLEEDYHLDDIVSSGALWVMPARVYARPLDLYPNKPLRSQDLIQELELLGYTKVDNPVHTKEYSVKDNIITYYAPAFNFWDGNRGSRRIKLTLKDDKVFEVYDLSNFQTLSIERLNPYHIASIFAQQNEDRILLKLKEVPPLLIDGIIATEDRKFRSHIGVDPKGLLRAFYVTLIKKNGQQGASTITQQFIKNHFLTNEKRVSRKIKEMLMALVLERHATKDQILEGYLNEIYLGQDGRRAIHGFGLASEYYYNKRLDQLDLSQLAMMIALVREPSSANPRRHPEAALKRRNFILKVMQQQNLISAEDASIATNEPLNLASKEQTSDRIRFPAFVDLVYKQLFENYKREDLVDIDGVNIFTTLDPVVQINAQKALTEGLEALEKSRNLKSNFLQGASVIVDPKSAEIKAIIGSRNGDEQGFNRALSASRQIGSTVKPAVYLTALELPARYTLATLIDNTPQIYNIGGSNWEPKNYSHNSPAKVILLNALVHSYNVSTVRIAMDLGIEDIINTLYALGFPNKIDANPSVALGAVQMTPLEVAQIYETYANGGYYTPLRSIQQISTNHGKIIQRFDLESTQAISSRPYFLLLTAMQQVVQRGTGQRIYQSFPRNLNIAGKTGTTNDYRDAWFSGFTGNNLAIAWVGNDQNLKTGLTGSSGGIPIWVDIMKQLPQEPLNIETPAGIIYDVIDKNSGEVAGPNCSNEDRVQIPFVTGSQPMTMSQCYDEYSLPEGFETNGNNFFPSEQPLNLQSIPDIKPVIDDQPIW